MTPVQPNPNPYPLSNLIQTTWPDAGTGISARGPVENPDAIAAAWYPRQTPPAGTNPGEKQGGFLGVLEGLIDRLGAMIDQLGGVPGSPGAGDGPAAPPAPVPARKPLTDAQM